MADSAFEFWLAVDDRPLKSSDVISVGDKLYWAAIGEPSDSELLIPFRFGELKGLLHGLLLSLNGQVDELIGLRRAHIQFSVPDVKEPTIELTFLANFGSWANPYSVEEYQQAFMNEASSCSYPFSIERAVAEEGFTEGFNVVCAIDSLDGLIEERLSSVSREMKSLSQAAVSHLLRKIGKRSLVASFSFPASLRTSCEQYLLYFGQFLEDLGIKVDSEIKEDINRVLFSVTPRDGASALGKIREALDAYLRFPNNPEFNAATFEFPDVAVAQLRANVLHLQSQLELAKAVMQAKDATIQALDFTVYQQQQFLSENATGNPSPKTTPPDDEPLFGDAVSVTQYEGKGFKVNIPLILRRLKRRLGFSSSKVLSNRVLAPHRDQDDENQ